MSEPEKKKETMIPKVFLAEPNDRFVLTSAEKFGEILYLTDSRLDPFNVPGVMEAMVTAFLVNGPCCLYIGFALLGNRIFANPPLGFSQQQTACSLAIRGSEVIGNPHFSHICKIAIFLLSVN